MKTKNIFCWLDEITLHKSSAEEFTDKDWENFNSYMVHRFISMNLYYTELADLAQSLMPNNKKQIYNLYKEMIPKRKTYFRYIKAKKSTKNKELIEMKKVQPIDMYTGDLNDLKKVLKKEYN